MQREISILQHMHSFKRDMGSATEQEFRETFLLPLGAQPDKFGNLHLTIGPSPSILWSSHTDTVHRGGGRQKIELDGKILRLAKDSRSSCLGADDGAGVFIMTEMILAKVPGLYIFHFGEERGGIGSNELLRHTPKVLEGIRAAIAFDRKGKTSVITHQGGGRTASDAFAKSLAVQLPEGYRMDNGGTFTDTKVYAGVVPECSNVAVGYEGAHTPSERLDVEHLVKLRDAMIKIDASRFVIERKAAPEFDDGPLFKRKGLAGLRRGYSPMSPKSMRDVVFSHSDDVAAVLLHAGIRADDLWGLIQDLRAFRDTAAMDLGSLHDMVERREEQQALNQAA